MGGLKHPIVAVGDLSLSWRYEIALNLQTREALPPTLTELKNPHRTWDAPSPKKKNELLIATVAERTDTNLVCRLGYQKES